MISIFSIIEKYQKYVTGEIEISDREKEILYEVMLEPFKSKIKWEDE